MADEVHNPPTEFPRPTDQGDSGLCTIHAIGNTIASEGMKHEVDFNLDSAITALVQFESDRNIHTGINPLDFHKKVFVLQDKTSKFWYHVHLSVERCNTAQCQAGIGKDQYVLVYPPNPSQRGTHCVYVQNIEKTPSGDCFRCINSWGTHEETPLININSQRIEIYKVMIQLTVNRSQGVSKSTDISALSMNLNERLHITGVIYLKKKSDYENFKTLHATKRLSCEPDIPIHCTVSNHIDLSNLTLIPTGFTNVIVEGDIRCAHKKDYDTMIKLHSACSITTNALVTCGSDNISTNIGEVFQLLPLLTKATKLIIMGDISWTHNKDCDMLIKLHSACSVTINAIVTFGSDNNSTNLREVAQLMPIVTKDTKLVIKGDISWTHNKDYDMLIKLHSACSVTINAIVTFGSDNNSTNLIEVAQLVPIVTEATKLVIKGSELKLRSPEDAQVFRQLSTTCRVTYSLQSLWLNCDVSGWEVDWLDWLAELVSAVPTVELWSAVKLTDNICGAVARRLEQPGAKLQNLWLYGCDMSLVSGAALADVWAKVSEVCLCTKLTEAQAVGVAGRLEGRDARLELLELGYGTDVSGVSGGAMANLIRSVSRVKTPYSGFSMSKTNVREMMGRLKQIGLSVDTGQLKMDTGWFWVAGPGEKVKLEITKDATGVKLSNC